MPASGRGTRDNRPSSQETDFVENFEPLLRKYLARKGKAWVYQKEVGAGRSIADLVAVRICEHRHVVIPSLSVRDAVILSTLRKTGSTRIDILEHRCGFERGDLRNGTIENLQAQGLLERGRGGQVRSSSWLHKNTFVVAFEAKISRWRRALEQAKEYLKYADEVYVVLPEENSKPAAKNRGKFEESGIGLLIVGRKGLKTLVKPKGSKNHDWRREYVCSKVFLEGAGKGQR